jgi:ribosome-associated protein
VEIASDLQAEDIVMLDIRKVAGFSDYFVIISGGSDRQISALRDEMVKRLKKRGVPLGHSEGTPGSGWLLLDFGDVIVHIFGSAVRQLYQLEQLWSKAPQVVRIQ